MIKPTKKSLCGRITCASLVACSPLLLPAVFAQDEDEDVFELSPFEVSADDQSGYRATSTLAGTRIKTDMKDVGAAISVATKEFLEDTGATNVQELLSYTTGTEVGGTSGNFAGSGAAAGNFEQNNQARANPAGNSRVRGLSGASMTRDYYLSPSWVGFDSYNTNAVTISRGPNSILFGIGEPGGIVDSTLNKATFGKEITTVGVRVGSNGTYRGTLDINRQLIEDRLAIRINAMHENIEYKQEPTYEEDTRFYATLTANLFKNERVDWLDKTELQATWETVTVEGTPPDPIPPENRYSHWWEVPGSKEVYELTGKKPRNNWPYETWEEFEANYIVKRIDSHASTGNPPQADGLYHTSQPAFWNSAVIVYANQSGGPDVGYDEGTYANTAVLDGTTGRFTAPEGFETPGWFPLFTPHQNGPWGDYSSYGFKNHVIQDKNVWNWEEKLLQGTSQFSNHDSDAVNVTLRQGFFNGKAGIELGLDKQEYQNHRFFPFGRANYAAIKLDNLKYLTNGELNPNLGRPYMSGQYDPENFTETTHETDRLTAYYELDFTNRDNWTRHIGKHTFTGLKSRWEKDNKSWGMARTWSSDDDPNQDYVANFDKPGAWGGRMFAMAYVGPSNLDVDSPDGLILYDEPLNLTVPQVGDQFENYYWDKETKELRTGILTVQDTPLWPGRQQQQVDSEGLTLQSKFLRGNLVTTYGWREDRARSWDVTAIEDPTDKSYLLEESFNNWNNDGEPVLDESGQTTSASAVLHIPSEWTRGLPLRPEFSLHYSESENFNPSNGVRRDVFNDVIGFASGETEEMGFSIRLMEDKVNMRFNWYETTSKNINNSNIQGSLWAFNWPRGWGQRWLQAKNQYYKSFDENGVPDGSARSFEETGWGSTETPQEVFYEGATGPFNDFDEAINFFLYDVLPESTVEAMNIQVTGELGDQQLSFDNIRGLSSVGDAISKGFEFEATFNLTKNWRLTMNASKTESIRGNGLSELNRYVEHIETQIGQYGDEVWSMWEGGASSTTEIQNRWLEATNPLAAAQAKEGTVASELRKWRANLVTRYDFREGSLKGFGLGGSLRWQDDIALGYPIVQDEVGNFVPVLDNPYMGGADMRGDIFFSYKKKFGEVPVTFQLNMQNFIGDDDPVPVVVNPDGQMAIIRSAPEKRWFLTTTMEF